MSISIARLKAIWPWLGEAHYVWIALGVIFVSLVGFYYFDASEEVVRRTGLVLQLIGIGTAGKGIKDWLDQFPLLRRTIELKGTDVEIENRTEGGIFVLLVARV